MRRGGQKLFTTFLFLSLYPFGSMYCLAAADMRLDMVIAVEDFTPCITLCGHTPSLLTEFLGM